MLFTNYASASASSCRRHRCGRKTRARKYPLHAAQPWDAKRSVPENYVDRGCTGPTRNTATLDVSIVRPVQASAERRRFKQWFIVYIGQGRKIVRRRSRGRIHGLSAHSRCGAGCVGPQVNELT